MVKEIDLRLYNKILILNKLQPDYKEKASLLRAPYRRMVTENFKRAKEVWKVSPEYQTFFKNGSLIDFINKYLEIRGKHMLDGILKNLEKVASAEISFPDYDVMGFEFFSDSENMGQNTVSIWPVKVRKELIFEFVATIR